jgi:carbon starvation protein
MNTLITLVLSVVVVYFAYAVYARRIDTTIIKADSKKATPARLYMDGVDFNPTSRNILYGYQFKSIAAAGPIVGAITAATFWGWLPSLLWLFVGVSFIGWVQDYSVMMMAVRRDGDSISALAHRLISPRSRNVLLLFIFFYLLLVAGAFGNLLAANIGGNPNVPLGLIVLCIAGVAGGQMLYKMKMDIMVTTIIIVGVTLLAIFAGTFDSVIQGVKDFNTGLDNLNGGSAVVTFFDPIAGKDVGLKINYIFWLLFVLAFSYFGSVLPIWRWAQPINYIGFWVMALTMIGGAIGAALALFAKPEFANFTLKSWIAWDGMAGKALPAGQVTQSIQPLWPMLFVTIACGAVSGWHSLVSSVGSARQLEYETDALPVGAGSMFSETFLSVLALMAVAVAGKGAGPAAFAAGIGNFLSIIGIPVNVGTSMGFAAFVIIVITVTQLVTRFMRVALTEALGERWPIAKNMQVGTIVSLILTFIIVMSGTFTYLWQLFGGANQLMASLALMLVTIWLLNEGKNALYAAIPMIFMYVTTVAANLVTAFNLWVQVVQPNWGKAGREPAILGGVLMILIAILLVGAALVIGWEAYKAVQKLRAQPKGVPAKAKA